MNKGEDRKKDIYNVIETIRKRPGMYLGSNSITALMHFLDGYRFAERVYDVNWRNELFPLNFDYMHEFVNVKLKCSNNAGWCHNILEVCNGNEAMALNHFFELYDEFVQVRMKRYWKTILTEKNIEWNNSMEHGGSMRADIKTLWFKNPLAVYVIELTIPAYILLVETTETICLEREFFSSAEEAKRTASIPFSAEVYFGKIDSWEEYVASDIEFGKRITRWW